MKIIILILSLFFASIESYATLSSHNLLAHSKQLIIITTPNLNAVNGQMQRYVRGSTQQAWKAVGESTPVVVGKNGMAWDANFAALQKNIPIKHEGDKRTPIGIYAIGPKFGFDKISNNQFDYVHLTNTSVCVDDVKSNFYNQLINSSQVSNKDWSSGEQMRKIPQYQFGAVVQYNATPIIPNSGSCIFMHIWKKPNSGTAGCVAMEISHLQTTLNWLNSRSNPVIAILPEQLYKKLKSQWTLPAIN